MRWQVRRGAAAVAVAVTAVVGTPVAATAAQGVPAGEIRTFAPDSCLDVRALNPADGADVIQYACGGTVNQRFRIVPQADGSVEILTFAGRCLDVTGDDAASGVPLIQYDCTGAPNQRFQLT